MEEEKQVNKINTNSIESSAKTTCVATPTTSSSSSSSGTTPTSGANNPPLSGPAKQTGAGQSDDDSGCALEEYSWVPPGLKPDQVSLNLKTKLIYNIKRNNCHHRELVRISK